MITMYVVCPECGERHDSEEVEGVDIEESPEGWDVLTYVCPVTGNEVKSLVYVKK